MFTFGRFLPPLPHSDHPNLIRARSGLRLIPDASKRSPYRAPFQNVPKSGLFLKSDEIKRSRIAILRADLIMDRGLGWWEKRLPFQGPSRGWKQHYMGLNLGLFLQTERINRVNLQQSQSEDFLGPDFAGEWRFKRDLLRRGDREVAIQADRRDVAGFWIAPMASLPVHAQECQKKRCT